MSDKDYYGQEHVDSLVREDMRKKLVKQRAMNKQVKINGFPECITFGHQFQGFTPFGYESMRVNLCDPPSYPMDRVMDVAVLEAHEEYKDLSTTLTPEEKEVLGI